MLTCKGDGFARTLLCLDCVAQVVANYLRYNEGRCQGLGPLPRSRVRNGSIAEEHSLLREASQRAGETAIRATKRACMFIVNRELGILNLVGESHALDEERIGFGKFSDIIKRIGEGTVSKGEAHIVITLSSKGHEFASRSKRALRVLTMNT